MSGPLPGVKQTFCSVNGCDLARVLRLADGRYFGAKKSGDGIVMDRAAIRAFADALAAEEREGRGRGVDALVPKKAEPVRTNAIAGTDPRRGLL